MIVTIQEILAFTEEQTLEFVKEKLEGDKNYEGLITWLNMYKASRSLEEQQVITKLYDAIPKAQKKFKYYFKQLRELEKQTEYAMGYNDRAIHEYCN